MQFSLNMNVRNYECDLQGIVNNAKYQSYFEHTRHTFLKENGIDFAEFHDNDKDLVVIESHLKYLKSLKSGDSFSSSLVLKKRGKIRYVYTHEIINSHGDICVKGEITEACVTKGRPVVCNKLNSIIENCK